MDRLNRFELQVRRIKVAAEQIEAQLSYARALGYPLYDDQEIMIEANKIQTAAEKILTDKEE